MSQFWVVGVPITGTDLAASRQQFIQTVNQYADPSLFVIPNYLQVGTIDKLMQLSDDLSKFEPSIGQLCRKIKRSYDETISSEPEPDLATYNRNQAELKSGTKKPKQQQTEVKKPLYVSGGNAFDTGDSKGVLPKDFLTEFTWSDIAYGSTTNIEKIKNDIAASFARTEEELKHATIAFNESKSNVLNYEKKINGNLLVRPISQFINPDQIVHTQHLTTVILAVPRAKEQEFLEQYQFVEQRYFDKIKAEEKKRKEQDEKERKAKEARETDLGRVAPAAAAKSPAMAPEEEEEKPPTDEELKKMQEKTTTPAKNETKVVYKPHAKFGLSSDAQYQELPTVVPGSAIKIVGAEQVPQDDFSLFRVVCFKRYTQDEQQQLESTKASIAQGIPLTSQQQSLLTTSSNVEKFKSICRDYRWTVRPFVYDPQEQQQLNQEIKQYIEQRRAAWEKLKTFCEELFDQVYRGWIHLIAMRAFVEIRLRYGLGNNWLSFVIYPKKNQERKVRDLLAKLYTEKGTEHLIGASDDGEYFPYVNVNVDLSDMM